MDWIADPQIWIVLITLTSVEIVLGVDNIIFISILVAKLPQQNQQKARAIGLGLAIFTRIALLSILFWFMGITAPLFTVFHEEISVRDLILICGGLFLLAKSTVEVHEKLEGAEGRISVRNKPGFAGVIIQIAVLDIVFSLDSVITAIGLANQLFVMMMAIILAVLFMLLFARTVGDFVEKHPTVQMLALSFLLLIGLTLIGEGLDLHIPKGYVYFAMAFSVFVEILNIRIRKPAAQPVKLHKTYIEPPPEPLSKKKAETNVSRLH